MRRPGSYGNGGEGKS